jgi:hypothetical protein
MKLGIKKTAMIRVRAGISYALTEAMHEGHCGLPTAELTPLAEKLLDVPQELIRTALDLELADGTVIADRLGETACIFLAGLYRAERAFAWDCSGQIQQCCVEWRREVIWTLLLLIVYPPCFAAAGFPLWQPHLFQPLSTGDADHGGQFFVKDRSYIDGIEPWSGVEAVAGVADHI